MEQFLEIVGGEGVNVSRLTSKNLGGQADEKILEAFRYA